ncbi:uncharacterized protein LOC126681828 [Mercurialis annua]|uniref:uncharacterized protein LOC126681828 n=1 Tax=Mercurialis annua TaxID=3986 RepID=UPI00215DEA38|nr:uncharacterized protein LOC126681828 [Mercurialis annua]
MMPPKPNQPLQLYISAAPQSLGCMLAQEDQGVERSVYYLSRALTDTETRYSDIEKLCLCLYFTCCKLRYYMLPVVVYVLAQNDVIKYILSRPYLWNRIGKWAVAMSEFTLFYVPQKAVKGQVLADFLADHPGIAIKEGIGRMELNPWRLWFDGSRTDTGAGAETVIVSPSRARFTMSFWGDSMLVIKQVAGEYKCESELLIRYCNKAKQLIGGFSDTWLEYTERNWRKEIIKWFESPDMTSRRLQTLALNYVVMADELYKRGSDGLLFRCISPREAMFVLAEVHEGIAGAHKAGPQMRWLIHKYAFYWLKMEQDCIRYSRGCEACQKCGPVQHVPTETLHSIIKPWPFCGWAVDLIGKIYPSSSKGHAFVIIATDYYSKWVEAAPLKSPSQESVIKFFKDCIILMHGLLDTFTTDHGTTFTGSDITSFAKDIGFKLVHSTLYYAQAYSQAEATNKAIKGIIQKMIEDNPK